MAQKKQNLRDEFLDIKSLDDLHNFFAARGFNCHLNDGELDIDISDEGGQEFIKAFVFEKASEISSRVRSYVGGLYCTLGISSDFENFYFARYGFGLGGASSNLRVLKYRISKEKIRTEDKHISLQRLQGLKFNHLKSWDELFDRKDISKKFYSEYKNKKIQLAKRIVGIADNEERSFYASVLLNRIIFLYFLQKKKILNGHERYLTTHLIKYKQDKQSYYNGFLCPLFFETLCIKQQDRSPELNALTGENMPYLNGGLFLKREIEEKYPAIDVDNKAFEEIFQFFESWFWHTSERDEGEEDAVSPYILGYIFEQSLGENKSQGVYYTPPFLSEFLTHETIYNHFITRLALNNKDGNKEEKEDTPEDALINWLNKANDDELTSFFEKELRDITVCDPACGSGQFLVEALHELSALHKILVEIAKAKTTQNSKKPFKPVMK